MVVIDSNMSFNFMFGGKITYKKSADFFCLFFFVQNTKNDLHPNTLTPFESTYLSSKARLSICVTWLADISFTSRWGGPARGCVGHTPQSKPIGHFKMLSGPLSCEECEPQHPKWPLSAVPRNRILPRIPQQLWTGEAFKATREEVNTTKECLSCSFKGSRLFFFSPPPPLPLLRTGYYVIVRLLVGVHHTDYKQHCDKWPLSLWNVLKNIE